MGPRPRLRLAPAQMGHYLVKTKKREIFCKCGQSSFYHLPILTRINSHGSSSCSVVVTDPFFTFCFLRLIIPRYPIWLKYLGRQCLRDDSFCTLRLSPTVTRGDNTSVRTGPLHNRLAWSFCRSFQWPFSILGAVKVALSLTLGPPLLTGPWAKYYMGRCHCCYERLRTGI